MRDFRFAQVSFSFPPIGSQGKFLAPPILQDLSFNVAPQTHLGIIGPSGAGKTTLLRLFNRLSDPSRGQIFWGSQPLNHYPVLKLRQQVMLVPQVPKLLGMTVEQALIYPLKLQERSSAEIQERLQVWLERFRIPSDWLGREQTQLSAGQGQWVCLTRALMASPEVLLLDEPTTGLDVGRIEQLQQILISLSQTVIMVSHQLDLIAQTCPQLLWLQAGQIFKQAATRELDWETVRQTLQAQQTAEPDWN
jgi:D-methionine transport system ATP-binding protein